MAHTPGPWKSLGGGIDACMVTSTLRNGRRVSFRVAACKDGDVDTVIANARLIAAAPDMLAALGIAREYMIADQARMKIGADMQAADPETANLLQEWISVSNERLRKIEAAITKATTQSQGEPTAG